MSAGKLGIFWDLHWKKFIGSGILYGVGTWGHNKYVRESERGIINGECVKVGNQPMAADERPVRLHVVVNKTAGKGGLVNLFKDEITAPLQLGAIEYHHVAMLKSDKNGVYETQYAGEAKENMEKLDLDACDGICVIGGDGLLQEVVTGLMRRPDRERVVEMPISFIPVGTAATFGKALHTDPSETMQSKMGRAALAIVQETKKKVDVMEITNGAGQKIFAMSAFGFGFVGAATEDGFDASYVKDHRYWYGAMKAAMLRGWPLGGLATLSYRNGEEAAWETRPVDVSTLVASSVADWGLGRMIDPERKVDDGKLSLSWIPSAAVTSRAALYSIGYRLSQGTPFIALPETESTTVTEFILQPKLEKDDVAFESTALPYHIDGEAMPAGEVHVKVLPQCLTFFAQLPYVAPPPLPPAEEDAPVEE